MSLFEQRIDKRHTSRTRSAELTALLSYWSYLRTIRYSESGDLSRSTYVVIHVPGLNRKHILDTQLFRRFFEPCEEGRFGFSGAV